MSKFIFALDQGIASLMAVLFDHTDAIRRIVQREFTRLFPQASWAQHDADEFWKSQLASIACQATGILGAIQKDCAIALHELRDNGRASHNNLLMQFQADTPGAAHPMVLAASFQSSCEEIVEQLRMACRFVPEMEADERTECLATWPRAMRWPHVWADA